MWFIQVNTQPEHKGRYIQCVTLQQTDTDSHIHTHRKPLHFLSDTQTLSQMVCFDVLSIILFSNRKELFFPVGESYHVEQLLQADQIITCLNCLLLCSLPATRGKQIPGKQPLPPEHSDKSF